MEWREGFKWFTLMVAAGVVTAIAIEFVTRYLEQKAILYARAELERLMVASTQATAQPQDYSQTNKPSHLVVDNSGLGYTNIT